MQQPNDQSFGLVIAYIIPGFISLLGVGLYSESVAVWLRPSYGPTVGGFLYVTLASIGVGLVVSAIRWLTIDKIHHATGLHRPKLAAKLLLGKLAALELLVKNYYRYYQFYANTIVATVSLYVAQLFKRGWSGKDLRIEVIVVTAIVVLFFASRDTLSNYYAGRQALMDGVENSELSDIIILP